MGSFISFVPTPFEDIEIFFALAPVTSSDTVYDLGSGDGRLLFAALEKGAGNAIGVELDLGHVREARETAKKKGLDARVAFLHADVMDVNLSDSTLVFCYLFTTASSALKPKFASELKPGTRIVKESFPVHERKPIKTEYHGLKTFYLYQMPPEIVNKYEPCNDIE
jgi:ribosomal protein L11 methylase PrmA